MPTSVSKMYGRTRFNMTLLAINAVCFGICCFLLAAGAESGPLMLLTIGTGLSAFAFLAGRLTSTPAD